MKRRFFIQKSTFGLLSFGFIPSSIFSLFNKNKEGIDTNIINLPISQKHVRHGLLTDNKFTFDIPISWLDYYKKDIFLKDGYLESEDDLIHITLKIDGELINLGIKENSFFISNDNGLDNYELKDNSHLKFMIKNGYEAEIITIKESYSLYNNTHDYLIFPISDFVHINGIKIDDNSAFSVPIHSKIEIQSINDSKILLIKKLNKHG